MQKELLIILFCKKKLFINCCWNWHLKEDDEDRLVDLITTKERIFKWIFYFSLAEENITAASPPQHPLKGWQPFTKDDTGHKAELGSISPTFYVQLLSTKILQAQKDQWLDYIFALLWSACVKAASKTLMKLKPEGCRLVDHCSLPEEVVGVGQVDLRQHPSDLALQRIVGSYVRCASAQSTPRSSSSKPPHFDLPTF